MHARTQETASRPRDKLIPLKTLPPHPPPSRPTVQTVALNRALTCGRPASPTRRRSRNFAAMHGGGSSVRAYGAPSSCMHVPPLRVDRRTGRRWPSDGRRRYTPSRQVVASRGVAVAVWCDITFDRASCCSRINQMDGERSGGGLRWTGGHERGAALRCGRVNAQCVMRCARLLVIGASRPARCWRRQAGCREGPAGMEELGWQLARPFRRFCFVCCLAINHPAARAELFRPTNPTRERLSSIDGILSFVPRATVCGPAPTPARARPVRKRWRR